jgi:surfeit locus 1 family protein
MPDGGTGMIRRMLVPLVFGLGGLAVLLALGTWQLQRLAWKEDILAGIAERMALPPGDVPAEPVEAEDEYRRVDAGGTFRPGEIHVYTSAPPRGVGYRVIAPFALEDGREILVDRGFVPVGDKDAPRPLGRARITGTLLWPDDGADSAAPPDLDRNVWLARDLPRMAEVLGTAPVLVVLSATDDPAAPMPLPAGVDIRNDHLEYAVTWFGLAAVWAVMTLSLLWRIKRRTE